MKQIRRTRGCQRSYCICRVFPIVSTALGGGKAWGSTQHSSLAHGTVLMTSGGSTPMFRHTTSATLTVFICSLSDRSAIEGVRSVVEQAAHKNSRNSSLCRSKEECLCRKGLPPISLIRKSRTRSFIRHWSTRGSS